jgi:hypothetical protein
MTDTPLGRQRGFAKCKCGQNLRSIWAYGGQSGKHVRLDGYGACTVCKKVYKVEVSTEAI